MVSQIRALVELENYIKRRVWKQTSIQGDNIILLLNFHIDGSPLSVKLEENTVTFEGFLINIDPDKCETLANILSQFMNLIVDCSNNNASVIIEYYEKERSSRFIVDVLVQLLNIMIDNLGHLAEKSFGVIKVAILDKDVYVLKRRDIENFMFLKGLIVTIPDYSGWIEANTGRDNIHLPLLSWVNERGDLEIGYVTSDKKLESVNLTRLIDKMVSLSQDLKLPGSISELDLVNKEFLMNTIWKLKSIQNGGDVTGLFQQQTFGLERDEIDLLLEDLIRVEKALAFNEALMNRVATRVASGAISTGEKEQLPVLGEEVIATTSRRVTRLGGGKAIYIGKEELKHIDFSEKANVKVVKLKDGRKVLVIEPL